MDRTPPVIAVLDDEPHMRKALRRLLVTHGFVVEEYEHAAGFLEAERVRPVDCLILDLHMPEFGGFDVLEELVARSACIPVVILTGHDEPGAAERAFALSASQYLKKPVDEGALLAAIALAGFSAGKPILPRNPDIR
ncbi:MAG: response regulator [Luteolibacter sp.]